MSKRYELSIEILNKDYVDQLIVALVRQGYNVYLNEEEGVVCCTITDDELIELKS
jgi:hypothetical protein